MNVLVLNIGSSSVKWAWFDNHARRSHGLYERVESFESTIQNLLLHTGVPDAIGHRVVHGGEFYRDAVIIDQNVIDTIESLSPLAPLHNPLNLMGITIIRNLYPHLPQIAVFDTAFHQTIPAHAFRYALSEPLYREHKIRRYGFHGTSHRYLLLKAAEYLQKKPEELNLITFHLGNGDSVCAIREGKSIDTSMGFTPLEGLIMGTRSGDLDPAIILFLEKTVGLTTEEIDRLLNKESGLKGICGESDMRDIVRSASAGDEASELAIEMFAYHAKKYLGAYLAAVGTVDAIVFTGGIGEHSAVVREKVLEHLSHLGIELDTLKNRADSLETHPVHSERSGVAVLVVHTDEEALIAADTLKLLTLTEEL